MTYQVKVTGTEHIDDYHGRVSTTDYANMEGAYEVIDNLFTSAKAMGWTGIEVYIKGIDEDEWTLVPKVDYV